VHLDDFGARLYRNSAKVELSQNVGKANEHNGYAELLNRLSATFDYSLRGEVAAHGVDRDG
jgi:hypothetical protein